MHESSFKLCAPLYVSLVIMSVCRYFKYRKWILKTNTADKSDHFRSHLRQSFPLECHSHSAITVTVANVSFRCRLMCTIVSEKGTLFCSYSSLLNVLAALSDEEVDLIKIQTIKEIPPEIKYFKIALWHFVCIK